MKICETGDLIEIDRRGFETWKNMSKKVSLTHSPSVCEKKYLICFGASFLSFSSGKATVCFSS